MFYWRKSHGFQTTWMCINDDTCLVYYSLKSCDWTQFPDSALRLESEGSVKEFYGTAHSWKWPSCKMWPCPACRVHITYNGNRDLLLPLQENGRECYEVTFKTWLPFRQRHSERFVPVICLPWEDTVPMFKVLNVIHKALIFYGPELSERMKVTVLKQISSDFTWQTLK